MVAARLNFRIVDEGDNILSDEARTPDYLVLPRSRADYRRFAALLRAIRGGGLHGLI